MKESLAGNKKPENRDAEILKALESLLVAPKQVALVDRLHEYKVLTARPKQPVAARTVPVVMPVPPPPVEDKPKCVEVQTEPLPAPVVETPHVPPPVVQQVIQPPPQPVIVQVPAQAGVERELIELMQTVVTSQQQTMQGNQALILSLIHERNAQPEPVFRDDVSEVSEETPPPAPAPPSPVVERAPTPPPAPVPPAPSPLRYSTAFGSVVLGGDLMVGPYTTQPAVIPSDQKPCLLRGIPLPSSRKRPPPDFSGDVPNLREGSSSDHLPTDPPPSDCTLGAGDVDGEGCVGEPSFKQEGAQGALAAAPLEPQDVHATSTEHKVNNNAGDVERTAPALQALEPTREQGSSAAGVLGLEGSGVSSTAGRGGSHQHTTPGIIEKVPVGSIPPHMRRIASAFTMRALSGPPDVPPPTAAGAAAASSSPSPSDPSAVTPCMSSEVGNVHTLMRNLHILSGMPVPAPAAQAITAEFIAEKISEGVQLGVKEALGLMDTHTPHRTYYDATSRPSARHGANPSSHISSNSNNRGLLSADKSHRLNYDQHHDQQEEVRHSLQLLKSRRGGAGSRRRGGTASSATDSTEFSDHSHCPQHQQQQHYNANHIRSTYYSRLPHVAVNTNDIHNNQDANKDLFQPPRRRELSAQKMRAEEADVMKEMELSRKHVHRLLQMDENSSFNDSVSLDEETAAHLRDPLLYNVQNADVSEMSSLDFGEHKNVRLVQRGEHRRRHQELFASQDAPHVRRDLPARSTPPNSAAATTPSKRSEAAGSFVGLGIVPLVSKVLAQSATEEALQNPRLCSAFAGSRSYEDDRNRGERDLSASVEDDMWVLDATAPLVQRNAGTGAGAESVSSRSILSLSTKSSSDSSCSMSQGDGGDDTDIVREKADSGEDILQLHGALSTADADAHVTATSSDVKAERDNRRVQIKAPSVPARSVAVSSSTDTSTSDSSGSAGRAAPRQSQLPRYSTTAKKTTTRSRSSSRGRSTESRRYPAGANMQSSRSDCDGPADVNTDRLAAQMMLNVLELHKPSNYTVQPYLTNPISTHTRGRSARAVLKRSKMYAGDSLDSTRSSESENTSQHSDINCTGSSVSSDDGDGKGLLDKMTNKGSSSLKLMGLGSSKLMTLRK